MTLVVHTGSTKQDGHAISQRSAAVGAILGTVVLIATFCRQYHTFLQGPGILIVRLWNPITQRSPMDRALGNALD